MCPAGCCARHGRGPLEEICEARTEVGTGHEQWASVAPLLRLIAQFLGDSVPVCKVGEVSTKDTRANEDA